MRLVNLVSLVPPYLLLSFISDLKHFYLCCRPHSLNTIKSNLLWLRYADHSMSIRGVFIYGCYYSLINARLFRNHAQLTVSHTKDMRFLSVDVALLRELNIESAIFTPAIHLKQQNQRSSESVSFFKLLTPTRTRNSMTRPNKRLVPRKSTWGYTSAHSGAVSSSHFQGADISEYLSRFPDHREQYRRKRGSITHGPVFQLKISSYNGYHIMPISFEPCYVFHPRACERISKQRPRQ